MSKLKAIIMILTFLSLFFLTFYCFYLNVSIILGIFISIYYSILIYLLWNYLYEPFKEKDNE